MYRMYQNNLKMQTSTREEQKNVTYFIEKVSVDFYYKQS